MRDNPDGTFSVVDTIGGFQMDFQVPVAVESATVASGGDPAETFKASWRDDFAATLTVQRLAHVDWQEHRTAAYDRSVAALTKIGDEAPVPTDVSIGGLPARKVAVVVHDDGNTNFVYGWYVIDPDHDTLYIATYLTAASDHEHQAQKFIDTLRRGR